MIRFLTLVVVIRVFALLSLTTGLSEDLYRDGYVDITSCDYSSVVIQKMKDACVDKSGLKCIL